MTENNRVNVMGLKKRINVVITFYTKIYEDITNNYISRLSSLCRSVLTSAPFPPVVKAEFEAYLIDHNPVIQRASNNSFVVATTLTSEAPLGLLHVRSVPNVVQCTCHKYKHSAQEQQQLLSF